MERQTTAHGSALGTGALVAVRPTRVPLAQIAKKANLFGNGRLQAWFRQADAGRPRQNLHDEAHGRAVWRVGGYLAKMLNFTDRERHLTAICCYGHDIGGVVGAKGHETAGARMIREWLLDNGASEGDADDAAAVVAAHRTSFILANGITSRVHAATAIADKAVGDELRLRTDRRAELEDYFGSGRMAQWLELEAAEAAEVDNPFRFDRLHLRVNFAIRPGPRLVVDGELCEMCLSLRLKAGVATHEDLLQLFGGRYRACHLAADYLCHAFRLQLDQQRYRWDDDTSGWLRIEDCRVPTG